MGCLFCVGAYYPDFMVCSQHCTPHLSNLTLLVSHDQTLMGKGKYQNLHINHLEKLLLSLGIFALARVCCLNEVCMDSRLGNAQNQ